MKILDRLIQNTPPIRPPLSGNFSLAERLGRTERAIPEEILISESSRIGRLSAIGESRDLARIEALPRRTIDLVNANPAAVWTGRLRRAATNCDCKARWGWCITTLNPIQGHALEEASKQAGILGSIGVGHGKTGIDLLLPLVVKDCKVALLLIPASQVAQIQSRDIPQWGVHFDLPNIAGGRFFTPGRPVLHIVTYEKISSASGTDLMRRIRPDLVILDEAHRARRRISARTKRVLRYFTEFPSTRMCALSGTITSRSLKDYAHLSELVLREGSPLPRHYPTVEEWASALDPIGGQHPFAAPIGALRRLCRIGENARQGFRRRLVETIGVVATEEQALGTSLVISERSVERDPIVDGHIDEVRETWCRPDGEELVEAVTKASVCRQIAAGFYYRWTWPRGETSIMIEEWLRIRKEWHKEVREKLKRSREFLDSPLLVTKAAIRFEDGYQGPLPTWKSKWWTSWKAIRETCKPQTEAVWVSDYLVKDVVEWAKAEGPGIIWYDYEAFGKAVADLGGFSIYGGGAGASEAILHEKGDRTIVASSHAHREIKNLQMFSKCLVANPSGDGGWWEQVLGRIHRVGQEADECEAWVYRHTEEMRDAIDGAIDKARYIQETMGNQQKLLHATYNFRGDP